MVSSPENPPFAQDGFAIWQERLAGGAGGYVKELLRRLSALPENLRRAVYAQVPGEEELRVQAIAAKRLDAPLAGVPFAVKDLYDMAGVPTGAGSTFLPEVRETPRETSPLVAKLLKLGAVYAGKVHLNEFAFGTTGENPHFGECPHPTVEGALVGGSSSGSAYAVAAGLTPLALGTDTAGSIRIPAAFCGLYGLKLAPNAWSQRGCFPLSPSFDTAGWLAANASDMLTTVETLLPGMAGHGLRGLALEHPCVEVESELEAQAGKLLGFLEAERDSETQAWFWHQLSGCDMAFGNIRSRETYEVHAAWLDVFKGHYTPVVWERINKGRDYNEEALAKAWKVRGQVAGAFVQLFEHYDFIALPITPLATPPRERHDQAFRNVLLSLTIPASFAALPALAVPLKLADGRSGGLQFIFKDEADMPLKPLLSALADYRP